MIERRIKICANSSYGGVFVYNLSSQLLEQYPFEVTAIQKGRGTYICTTSEGGKIIMGSFRGSKGRESLIIAHKYHFKLILFMLSMNIIAHLFKLPVVPEYLHGIILSAGF